MKTFKDKLNIGVVNMNSSWGDPAANISKMDGYIAEAAEKGVQFLLFPELCVTGYCDGKLPDGRRMHPALAEAFDGPTACHFAELAKKHGMYIIYGMPELIPEDPDHAYNSAFIAAPDGSLDHFRKVHPVEPDWCVGGDSPKILETPWGPVGLCVCYDTYAIPELERYYAARGCRMVINPTASMRGVDRETGDTSGWGWYFARRLETIADRDGIFVASANLTGPDGPADENGRTPADFPGGSNVMSPAPSEGKYCSCPIGSLSIKTEGLYSGEVDLSESKRDFFQLPIYQPGLYAKWYEELAKLPSWPPELPAPEKTGMRIAVSNFDAAWGDKAKNLEKMEAETREAAAKGADLVLFPELALTGYWYKEPEDGSECMQHLLAETIPGPSSDRMAALAKELGVYIAFGLPEKAGDVYYNSAAILTPEGETLSYRKIHPIGDESKWAVCGDKPFMFETPWGRIGVSICYDTYFIPELSRYYAANGCKIMLNPTASLKGINVGKWEWYYKSRLESIADRDGIIVASSNLCGPDGIPIPGFSFPGGSVVLGATWTKGVYHAGCVENKEPGIIVSEPLDLSKVRFWILCFNPALYATMYKDMEQRKKA
ncbi:MAG: carbon-nitrogen hydrolase family protein [Firmicutes bacterium]|nr:carbon-nitrogen hydrolase family protein [Bacillota bacterium]